MPAFQAESGFEVNTPLKQKGWLPRNSLAMHLDFDGGLSLSVFSR